MRAKTATSFACNVSKETPDPGADAVVPVTRLSEQDMERLVYLCAMRDIWTAKLNATQEGQAFTATARAMSALEKEIESKYGIPTPFTIGPGGEIIPDAAE